jgi:hypothetical protein
MSTEFDQLAKIVTDRLGQDDGRTLLLDICRALNGRRVYVPRYPTLRDNPDQPIAVIQERYSVSRATAYNWVNRWKR